jgi:hypothetical protein
LEYLRATYTEEFSLDRVSAARSVDRSPQRPQAAVVVVYHGQRAGEASIFEAFQTRIARKIDHPHAAAADLSLDFVRPNSLKMILIHATSLTAARYQVALKGFGNAVFVCFLRSESRSN